MAIIGDSNAQSKAGDVSTAQVNRERMAYYLFILLRQCPHSYSLALIGIDLIARLYVLPLNIAGK